MIETTLQAVANHLWQSTLFAAAAGLLALLLRRNRARVRYWIWLAASVKFLVPFSFLVDAGSHLGPRTSLPRTPPAVSDVIFQVAEPFTSSPHRNASDTDAPPRSARTLWIPAALYIVWILGSAAVLASWWRRSRGLRAALRNASPLHLENGVKAMVSNSLLEPGVFGIARPVLLLPAAISDRLTPPQFDAVIAHELFHVRRRDNLATAFHMCVEALFWFHPLVWWLGARLMDERERACDEEVLLDGRDPEAYAGGILKICELYLESPLPCVSGVTGANLRKRIEDILSNRIGLRLSAARKILVAVAGAVALAAPFAIGIMTSQRAAIAQEPSTHLSFDAASLKPSAPGGGPFSQNMGGPGTRDPGRIRYTNFSLKMLLVAAYGVNDFQIEGPGWMESAHFDIDATLPPNSTRDQFREMLRNLLLDRFHIALHHEAKEVAGHILVTAKNVPRLTESTPPSNQPDGAPPPSPGQYERDAGGFPKLPPGGSPEMMQFVVGNRARLSGRMQTMSDLAARLAYLLGHPVGNATNLTAKYDFTLTFAAEGTALNRPVPPMPGQPPPPPAVDTEPPPDLFTALQSQLGLKLEPKKVPMDIIVIDRADKIPVSN